VNELEISLKKLIDAICDRLEEIQSDELLPQIVALQADLSTVQTTLERLSSGLKETQETLKDLGKILRDSHGKPTDSANTVAGANEK